ncbi:hypothetical protein B0H67DRAFT_641509 [Lasiosphaeris hirsuta]|uniref:Uncharacterized protein n=1 Tax=Lasiosphaeris hirsuta TaxID=260670 RepID=A0AA40AZW7_9PEZI|nr:hypothetical protein B0H67DRAFT_641509 [Lasiosphaeris hirsuta]
MADYKLTVPTKRAISEDLSTESESSTPATRRANRISGHRSAKRRATETTNISAGTAVAGDISTGIAPLVGFADMVAALPAENPFDDSHFVVDFRGDAATMHPPSEPGAESGYESSAESSVVSAASASSTVMGPGIMGKFSAFRKERLGTRTRRVLKNHWDADDEVEDDHSHNTSRETFKSIYRRLKTIDHGNQIMDSDMVRHEVEILKEDIVKMVDKGRCFDEMVGQVRENISGLQEDIVKLKGDFAKLQATRHIDEKRATYRHKMLFNSLKKISEDLNDVKAVQQQLEKEKEILQGKRDQATMAPSPSTPKKPKKVQKKTKEQFSRILDSFIDEMDSSTNIEDVVNKGELCVRYAEDFFKNF